MAIGAACLAVVLAASWFVAGCGKGMSTGTVTGATSHATVVVSDPATCMAPSGPFSHVYVTIKDVKATVNASAGDNDPSFVDLTPDLSSTPKQIDLLGQANNQCFLSTLGDTLQLQPGSYQQIRIILADNSASVSGNACSGSANCVVLSDGSSHTLQLSSESKTGIKIPSGQIASGAFTIAAGETKDLDIDFNTCVSIVTEGNGTYRLKPVLHAGEVTTTSSSINGTVVDSATGDAVSGPVLVALEQKDAAGIDRVFMSTLTDAKGAFVFCPLPSGTYDVVIVGSSSTGIAYAPTVVTGVANGSAMAVVKLYAQSAPGTGAALLNGVITSASGTGATSADVQVSVLSQLASGLVVTVPLIQNSTQTAAVLAVSTEAGAACPTGTDCAAYSVAVPALSPYAAAFSAGGVTLTAGPSPASYKVDAIAFVPQSGGTLDCSTSDLQSAAVAPVAGSAAVVQTLAFQGCQ
jgi:hypothetical protein